MGPVTHIKVLLPIALPELFSYAVPDHLSPRMQPGIRVLVQFGAKKTVPAIIWEVCSGKSPEGLKLVLDILDQRPIVNNLQRKFWEWMSEYYLCTLGEVMKAALPNGIKKLDAYEPKQETILRLHPDCYDEGHLNQILDSLTNAPRQHEFLIRVLDQINPFEENTLEHVQLKQVARGFEAYSAVLNALIKKSVLVKDQITVSRIPDQSPSILTLQELSPAQKKVFDTLKLSDPANQVSLLHGVTSSGKTEIYIHLIDKQLKEGKQVLYLLPEIALSEQMINRLRSVFGNKVGVYHSRYSNNERMEIWNQIFDPDSEMKILLGARSSLFLPFHNLGLIIVDEEHEPSYKQQDPAPRYHARDSAIVLSRIHQASVILGTATPSLESYYNCKSGKYKLVQLNSRFGNIQLPDIILANTKEAYRKKKIRGHLTPALLEAIDQALVNKEQIILFQNRRGYSPYIECSSCGHIPKCRDCDVSLTLHKTKRRIVCHYCGYFEPVPDHCTKCKGTGLHTKGLGTEGLEEEISYLFPEARLARLDLDSVRAKNSYSKILRDFELRKTDILIGTQMVSKGLDFNHVRVVGIINADNQLHFPDFRSFERSFQLMTQVSGRAGRKNKVGMVVIQTFDPGHRIIQQVLRNDYLGFYKQEILERRDFAYPPFTRLIRINLKHKDPELVARCAHYLAKDLRKRWGDRILGPQAPGIQRIQNKFLRTILIKSGKGKEMKSIRDHIRNLMTSLKKDKQFASVIVQADVDPH